MKREAKKNPKISGGYVDTGLTMEDVLSPANYKMRITAMIDGDLLDWLKKSAAKGKGRGMYQVFLNEIIRKSMNEDSNSDLIIIGNKRIKYTKKRAENLIRLLDEE